MSLTKEDVVNAYRFILGREPENDDAIAYHIGRFRSREALRRNFMDTNEFRNLYSMLQSSPRDKSFDFSLQRIVFSHIPKTGGTTITRSFERCTDISSIFPDNYRISEYPADFIMRYRFFFGHFGFHETRYIPGDKYTFTILREPKSRIISQYLYHRSRSRKNLPFADDILLVRSQLSLKDYLRDPDVRLHPAVNNAQCNSLLSLSLTSRLVKKLDANANFLLDNALENLRNFNAVGVTDQLGDLVSRVAQDTGLPLRLTDEQFMVTRQLHEQFPDIYLPVTDEKLDDETDELLAALVEYDAVLYQTVKDQS